MCGPDHFPQYKGNMHNVIIPTYLHTHVTRMHTNMHFLYVHKCCSAQSGPVHCPDALLIMPDGFTSFDFFCVLRFCEKTISALHDVNMPIAMSAFTLLHQRQQQRFAAFSPSQRSPALSFCQQQRCVGFPPAQHSPTVSVYQ